MSERPYTSRAQKALSLAESAAMSLGHEYIGTEHILLGLVDEATGPAAQLLAGMGVTGPSLRQELQRLLQSPQ